MPFDTPIPSLAELDLQLQNLLAALLDFEDSGDIEIELVNDGTGVRWNLASQTPEYVSLDDGSAVALTTATPIDVVQLVVPAGKKMIVTGCVVYKPNASVTSTLVAAGCGITSATLPSVGQYMGMQWSGTNVVRTSAPIPERFFDNSAGGSDVTVYLVAQCNFSAGAVSVSGWLRGRLVP